MTLRKLSILLLLSAIALASGFYANELIALGAEFFKSPPPPTSRVDASCASLWVKDARNDPALTCYLTRDIKRLCAPAEKIHLGYIMKRYNSDRASYEAMLASYIAGTRIGFSQGPKQRADGTTETSVEQIHRVSRENAQVLKERGFDKAFRLNSSLDDDLVELIRKLGEDGYMTEADYGWFAGDLVVQAYHGLGPVPAPSC
ncbi:MAG: hypothetical protein M3O03_04325 [Pseudomonadota bacterium]|nr:hypothetical protein [Pseudomonadota bacterium]